MISALLWRKLPADFPHLSSCWICRRSSQKSLFLGTARVASFHGDGAGETRDLVAFAMSSPSWATCVACARRAPTVSSQDGGPERCLYSKSLLKKPLVSSIRKAPNFLVLLFGRLLTREARRQVEELCSSLERKRRRFWALCSMRYELTVYHPEKAVFHSLESKVPLAPVVRTNLLDCGIHRFGQLFLTDRVQRLADLVEASV